MTNKGKCTGVKSSERITKQIRLRLAGPFGKTVRLISLLKMLSSHCNFMQDSSVAFSWQSPDTPENIINT